MWAARLALALIEFGEGEPLRGSVVDERLRSPGIPLLARLLRCAPTFTAAFP